MSISIIVLINLKKAREEFSSYDVGAAVENILLAAKEMGIGSCWMYSIDRTALVEILGIPAFLRLDCVVSLGYPAESPQPARFKGCVKYYLDKGNTLHVPKRSLSEVLYYNRYKKRGRN
jgi:nitroreductase